MLNKLVQDRVASKGGWLKMPRENNTTIPVSSALAQAILGEQNDPFWETLQPWFNDAKTRGEVELRLGNSVLRLFCYRIFAQAAGATLLGHVNAEREHREGECAVRVVIEAWLTAMNAQDRRLIEAAIEAIKASALRKVHRGNRTALQRTGKTLEAFNVLATAIAGTVPALLTTQLTRGINLTALENIAQADQQQGRAPTRTERLTRCFHGLMRNDNARRFFSELGYSPAALAQRLRLGQRSGAAEPLRVIATTSGFDLKAALEALDAQRCGGDVLLTLAIAVLQGKTPLIQQMLIDWFDIDEPEHDNMDHLTDTLEQRIAKGWARNIDSGGGLDLTLNALLPPSSPPISASALTS
jgi:hypothetical protein